MGLFQKILDLVLNNCSSPDSDLYTHDVRTLEQLHRNILDTRVVNNQRPNIQMAVNYYQRPNIQILTHNFQRNINSS